MSDNPLTILAMEAENIRKIKAINDGPRFFMLGTLTSERHLPLGQSSSEHD